MNAASAAKALPFSDASLPTQQVPDDPPDLTRVPALWALVPCAGEGLRALGDSPKSRQMAQRKQYQLIAGLPMVLHTLAAFAGVQRLAGTLVAISVGDTFFDTRASAARFVVACGGATRADTVRGGLAALRARGALDSDWVLVHDAARCLVSAAQINSLIDACISDTVGGLLAHKLPDTLKSAGDDGTRVVATLDRSDKWLAQTPQMFRLGRLSHALAQCGSAVTDEASAMEALGERPLLVPGSALNFKVTYPEDFALAEAVLMQRMRSATTDTNQ